MTEPEGRWKALEEEIERRLVERFAALRDEFDRLRLESDRRWAGFLDRFEQKLTGIVPADMFPSESAAAPAASSGMVAVDTARALDEAGNQVEALHRFLDLCRGHASRVALLVSRGGAVGVWKALGFTEHGGSDETARRATPPSAPGSVLARVMEGTASELVADNDVSASLAAHDATRGVLIPMVVKEKISGALYADCVAAEENQFDPEALGFLTFLAGLIVDRLASRKLKPAPALTSLQTGAAAEAAPLPPTFSPAPASLPASAFSPAPVSEPEFELAEQSAPHPLRPISGANRMMTELPTPSVRRPAPPPVPIEEPRRPTAAPFSRPSFGPEESAVQPDRAMGLDLPPSLEPGRTMRIPSVSDALASSAPSTAAEAPRARPSTGARRLGGPLAPAEGDERRDEARRFAKLLVSEIKLYNEKAVAQGREQGNIYQLLKEDIDRSRQMYDERIPEDVRANSNFFYEELVRILADGRSDALGL